MKIYRFNGHVLFVLYQGATAGLIKSLTLVFPFVRPYKFLDISNHKRFIKSYF